MVKEDGSVLSKDAGYTATTSTNNNNNNNNNNRGSSSPPPSSPNNNPSARPSSPSSTPSVDPSNVIKALNQFLESTELDDTMQLAGVFTFKQLSEALNEQGRLLVRYRQRRITQLLSLSFVVYVLVVIRLIVLTVDTLYLSMQFYARARMGKQTAGCFQSPPTSLSNTRRYQVIYPIQYNPSIYLSL